MVSAMHGYGGGIAYRLRRESEIRRSQATDVHVDEIEKVSSSFVKSPLNEHSGSTHGFLRFFALKLAKITRRS